MEANKPTERSDTGGGRVAPLDSHRPYPRVVRKLGRLAGIAVLTYLGVCLVVGVFQKRLIYFPSRGYDLYPRDFGLPFEEVSLRTADGVTITAWYVPCDGAKATVIYAHGNAGNLSDCLSTLHLFHRLGCNVLAFDYRGFGSSEGSPGEEGTYRDAEAAWTYLVESRGEARERIVLFGRSLGGAVMIELARRKTPAALIVEATFTSLADVGRHHYPWLPGRWLLRHRYDSLSKIAEVRCPKLFIHSEKDSLIPIAMGRRLFEATAAPKEFLESHGDHSGEGFAAFPPLVRRVDEFLDTAVSGNRP